MRDKLIKYRGKRSQEEMAKMYGVSQQAWSKYENGTAVPSPSIMLRIERDSGIKMEDIFFDKFKQPNVVK
ncbi:helix-turn-helix transcriptional regulator [Megasphaera elsdenii]|uniref:helix-turn-helix transcriptional regulator n=1 Tax=Megasphaera elsdenii TaxID=907 RepID=UPI0009337F92|nr:helix-turn-helix transcriptional regulator [Megasphaera elsdenii]